MIRVNIIAVEAAGKGIDSGESAATSALGKEGIIHGSKTLLMQTSDGQITEPYSISAGLDYPGVGPMHANLFRSKRAEFISITDEDAMKAGLEISKLEGIIPAIETAHAFAAFEYIEFKEDDIVVVNFSGRGDKDLNTYIEYSSKNNSFKNKKKILSIYFSIQWQFLIINGCTHTILPDMIEIGSFISLAAVQLFKKVQQKH